MLINLSKFGQNDANGGLARIELGKLILMELNFMMEHHMILIQFCIIIHSLAQFTIIYQS